ncbi:MAG: 8-oxo-dGTP diphosphatase MutT [Alphaproteobacteria bacterium CG11_big_fil_rev_8_21_14_0_20_39_49]|nr:MAG: 8-oxo-dGTP diphosphatase MutT [Alphaproteobacteria bacterium CG11_big_fil_rev_8_21_14_0_20_39_49]
MYQGGCDPAREYPELLEKVAFKYVAAGVLVDKDEKILIAKRPEGKPMAGLWEFPGGKAKEGEVPEIALVRELKEELGIRTSAGCLLPLTFLSHRYADFHLIMYVFVCRRWEGAIEPKEGQELKWIEKNRLSKYDMPDANMPLIGAVRNI